jgi:hypothetical protein
VLHPARHVGSELRGAAEEAARPDDGGDGDRAPLGSIERGRLRFSSGASRLALRATGRSRCSTRDSPGSACATGGASELSVTEA